MSKLLIFFLIVWGLTLFRAWRKGFLKSLISLAFLILFFVLVGVLTPATANVMNNSENVTAWAQETCEGYVRSGIKAAGGDVSSYTEGMDLSDEERALLEMSGGAAADMLLASDTFIAETAAVMVPPLIKLVALGVTALILMILLFVISLIVNHSVKVSRFSGPDKVLGLMFGLFKCLMWAWLILGVIRLLALIGAGAGLVTDLENSLVLTLLYKNNPVFDWCSNAVLNFAAGSLLGALG
ncbi:MAG: hypothetical protein Q4B73_09955 [Lachnospiraceae bacterium]|nr:hypothetical protein [Lachnospiraceae bacterium]